MAPLDSPSAIRTRRSAYANSPAASGPYDSHVKLAQMLKDARLAQGLSLENVSEMTRVRVGYLAALEDGAIASIPSRAFAIGYVRAYARALGLDDETAAERFKAEYPEGHAPLAAPVGAMLHDVKPSYTAYAAALGVVIVMVALWNVAQRLVQHDKPKSAAIAEAPATWSLGGVNHNGVVTISPPEPAPSDQSVPKPYITPGLPPEVFAVAADPAPSAAAPVSRAFNPKGALYGVEPTASVVTLQATKSAYLVLRTADNTVYFARQLAAGEAYRAPAQINRPLLVEVSDPHAFDVFFNGEFTGQLPDLVTPLAKLNSQAADRATAEAEAKIVADAALNAPPQPQQ